MKVNGVDASNLDMYKTVTAFVPQVGRDIRGIREIVIYVTYMTYVIHVIYCSNAEADVVVAAVMLLVWVM